MKLLHIDSSILGQGSVSRELSAEIVARFRARDPGLTVTHLDLAATPIGHLAAEHLAAAQGAPVDDALKADVDTGQHALDTFLAADIVVVGAPMYNFGIPSQLKAWIDRILVAGKTFRYDENGPEGLCGGKKLVIASSRGGVYSAGSPVASLDHQETYLKDAFAFIGITDITFIRAEGVAMGPDKRTGAIASAKEAAAALAA
ncbi:MULTISPECIES: FMN-dependent NADH-azoreductase [Burkholderia cepacia complex]|jgi:FMN-dependent NADH-azoreductase|uniref:FMN-dependent NADH-azoreductase n=1 Tax=Burkholderia cepacia complex TaxID=87882 RepID=UPI0009821126|nr:MULTISPECIES: FMN-dependent NADH-azoreductase [Burkholderia cepacia complex]AQQ27860.1 FMN-dependent NADH-azoreductase [Burkholderia cenocepacia]MBR8322369.1 FMN-dependent NADH-azoreductase [Burkholderia cenocepacia]MDN7580267.1 FMN-dependent NADH-azoreductase [Burkholderia orbicola]ONV84597.1 FMN-dependent NADH-azoreductase [Burkholderia cenocepacia]ONW08779.1 FMN-dependent NADH-azoreductase [Burkholderia cenocepacia]